MFKFHDDIWFTSSFALCKSLLVILIDTHFHLHWIFIIQEKQENIKYQENSYGLGLTGSHGKDHEAHETGN